VHYRTCTLRLPLSMMEKSRVQPEMREWKEDVGAGTTYKGIPRGSSGEMLFVVPRCG